MPSALVSVILVVILVRGSSVTAFSEATSMTSAAVASETALAVLGDGIGRFGDGVGGDGFGDVGDGIVGGGVGEVGVGILVGTFRLQISLALPLAL